MKTISISPICMNIWNMPFRMHPAHFSMALPRNTGFILKMFLFTTQGRRSSPGQHFSANPPRGKPGVGRGKRLRQNHPGQVARPVV